MNCITEQARHGTVQIRRGDETLFSRVRRPSGFWQRARGLIGRPPLGIQEAWWFERCNSIHMLGMLHSIDVMFLDAAGRVLKTRERLPPFAMSACLRAESVIEMASGSIRRKRIAPGQRLEIVA
jgi:uncharacterized membrane protein (UPF0127 family)